MTSIQYLTVIKGVISTQVRRFHIKKTNHTSCYSTAESLSQLRSRTSFTPDIMAQSPKLFPELQRQNEARRIQVDSERFRVPTTPRQPVQNALRGTAKPITNPLLQKLFNKNSILFASVQGSPSTPQPAVPPSINNLRPFSVKRPALTFPKEEPRTIPAPRPSPLAPTFSPVNPEMLSPAVQPGADIDKQKLFQTLLNQKKEKEKHLQEILRQQQMKEASQIPLPVPRPIPPQFEATPAVVSPGRSRILSKAEAVVARRESSGESMSSPEVWAAVKVLSQFLERERGNQAAIPDSVVMAIIQLTEFLETEDQPRAAMSAPGPSDAQIRLRQRLKEQADSKKARISEILAAKSSVEMFMDMERVEMDIGRLPDSFMFSTLPVH